MTKPFVAVCLDHLADDARARLVEAITPLLGERELLIVPDATMATLRSTPRIPDVGAWDELLTNLGEIEKPIIRPSDGLPSFALDDLLLATGPRNRRERRKAGQRGTRWRR